MRIVFRAVLGGVIGFLCFLLAEEFSVRVLNISGRMQRWHWSYHLSFWSLLIGALILLYAQDMLAWRALALPSVITFFMGLFYFRTRWWNYIVQPILFGFFVLSFLSLFAWIVFLLGAFVLTPYTIAGMSMAPNYVEGDIVLVSQAGDIQRGDVIMYAQGSQGALVRRVIGIPGDVVKYDKGYVEVCSVRTKSCNVLPEPYLLGGVKTEAVCGMKGSAVKVGYFVMGDNRDESIDSRCCLDGECRQGENGEVMPYQIVGEVMHVIRKKDIKAVSDFLF